MAKSNTDNRQTATACHVCGLVQGLPRVRRGFVAKCGRCGSTIATSGDSLSRAAAFSLAALILYIPANIYPVLKVTAMGVTTESTIWSGTRALAAEGMWFVAAVVFIASILVPLMKITGLGFLILTIRWKGRRRDRTRLWRAIELVGKWSMLDVFLLAILVAHLKLNDMATVVPGPGIIAFTAVVVLTMLASASFDPKLLWPGHDEASKEAA